MGNTNGKLSSFEKDEIVKEYSQGNITLEYLAKKYNVSGVSIGALLRRRKITVKGRRKYYFDENAFENITTPEQAYWLGFIFADGNIYETRLGITQSHRDVKHLLKFAHFMKANPFEHKMIYHGKKDIDQIRFHSTILVSHLKKYGCVPSKTRVLKTPILNSQLYGDFYRGYIDGDGWFSLRKKENTWYFGAGCASKEYLEDLRKWLYEKIGHNGNFIEVKKRGNRNPFWQLTYSGNPLVSQIATILYKNNIVSLDRKCLIATKLMETLED